MLHKDWKDYTEKEIHAIKMDHCCICSYSCFIGTRKSDEYVCDYLLMTGKRREKRPENCKHYLDILNKKKYKNIPF